MLHPTRSHPNPNRTPQPDWFWLWLRLRPVQGRSDAGLTLLEGLVAIILVAVAVTAMTPPIFIATATRIQTRRIEQANQIAQAEVDRIRLQVERGNYNVVDLPASIGDNPIQNAPAATANSTAALLTSRPDDCGGTMYPTATPAPVNQVVQVDQDGDCQPDFIMQVFRNDGEVPIGEEDANGQPKPFSFDIGVRVYHFAPGTTPTLLTDATASGRMTSGRNDTIDGDRRRPLAMLYTKISRSDNSKSLSELCKSLDNSPNRCP